MKKNNKLDGTHALELKKHVAIIHSHSKISLLQRKIANALLYHAYDNLLNKDEHTIQIRELTDLIGYDSHDHRKIKNALIDLLSTVVEWNIVDRDRIDKEESWNASSIIADASIQGSSCTYSYSNKMRQLLYHPSVYGRLNLLVQAQFQSGYGLALYENCNRYQDIGQTPWFELETFRKLMGVEDSKYQIFRDLKTRVINKAVQEVNQYASIRVEAHFRKSNRQVVAIQFIIQKVHSTQVEEKTEHLNSVEGRLSQEIGLTRAQIKELYKKYPESYISEKLDYMVQSSSYRSGKIQHLARYFLSALEENYQFTASNSKIKRADSSKSLISHEAESAYRAYVCQKIMSLYQSASKLAQQKYQLAFEKHIARSIYQKMYLKEGLANVLVQEQFVQFLLVDEAAMRQKVLALNEWLQLDEIECTRESSVIENSYAT